MHGDSCATNNPLWDPRQHPALFIPSTHKGLSGWRLISPLLVGLKLRKFATKSIESKDSVVQKYMPSFAYQEATQFT